MNLNYATTTLMARANETYTKSLKDKLRRLTSILGGKQMGAATLTREKYDDAALQALKNKVRDLTTEIAFAEQFQREIREEIARLAEGVTLPRGTDA